MENLMGDIVNFEGGIWLEPLVVQVGIGSKD